jgi:hypothetical protein
MYSHPDLYSPKKRIIIDITENNGYIIVSDGKIFSCANEKEMLSILGQQMYNKKKEGEQYDSVNL